MWTAELIKNFLSLLIDCCFPKNNFIGAFRTNENVRPYGVDNLPFSAICMCGFKKPSAFFFCLGKDFFCCNFKPPNIQWGCITI